MEDIMDKEWLYLSRVWILHIASGYFMENNQIHQIVDVQMLESRRMFEDFYAQRDEDPENPPDGRKKELESLVHDAETPLYPGCKAFTKMSDSVAMFKHKASHGLSDSGFDELISLVRDMLPENNTLPSSFYEMKKLVNTFDLGYEKIHACYNDCCLYRKELEHAEVCPKCGSSRWKVNKRTKKIEKKVPAKVLRYFPIIPRLKIMFGIDEMETQLRWHASNKSSDDKIRHPVDSLSWETINRRWPHFASDPRNIRLGLATDRFNPFKDLSSNYSCWPVILTIYNLPPSLCMLKESLMLSLLIPGPKQPGNDIDVFLAPLVDDLILLWNDGVEMYDAVTKCTFNLKAILMWTIHDFPAYGNISGWPVKGKIACPICREDTYSLWLKHGRKFAYMGHRRFLCFGHPFRKKKKTLLVRHNLDVMHVEKNICDSILDTLLDVKGKSKDGINSRKDLEAMNIRHDLHPESRGDKFYLPVAPHTLSKPEREMFCKRLANLRLPDGYGSNIGNCISMEELKIVGLKSHDCHILMQQLLPIALRGLLPKGARNSISKLCSFFNAICQRVVDRNNVEQLEEDVIEIVCMLEMYFPPSFFDIMVHLTIHIGREVSLCGPVQYRWMYPFERYMKVLKGYVMNRARPEGCIAEHYVVEENAMFCSKYITQAFEIGAKIVRNEEYGSDFLVVGRTISKGKPLVLSDDMLKVAHRYVLSNNTEVQPYIKMHMAELKSFDKRLERNETLLHKKHIDSFATWLDDKIKCQLLVDNVSSNLMWLARGPRCQSMSYSGFVINGLRFYTKDAEKSRQNSGILVEATTICRSSAKDNAHAVGQIIYYGVLHDVIILDYNAFHVPIFKCDWANIVNGIRREDGFTLVNLHEGLKQFENDPFILATQAKQVFYSRENETSSWYVALQAPSRDFHGSHMEEDTAYEITIPLDISQRNIDNLDDDENYARIGVEGFLCDP
ncbi:uncharacterized protein LOC111390092 [Olea europaea var. sylvestris]|uniref:uncharacterized protein LOC111390092 n=1 Tax=Olea europaea var. sylvestris TaxID=158386 RepID=UPI000C1D77A9|nr:uncharacterized protein LOC111390092 [Olea europaea var. sylvestris]